VCVDGYTNSEVNIRWLSEERAVRGVDKMMLSQFRIANYKTSTYIEVEATGGMIEINIFWQIF